MQMQCRNRHFIGQVDQTFVPYRSTNIWCVLNRAAISQSELMVMVIPSTEYRDWRLAVQPRFRDQFKTLLQYGGVAAVFLHSMDFKSELCMVSTTRNTCSPNFLLLRIFHLKLHFLKRLRIGNGSPSKSYYLSICF